MKTGNLKHILALLLVLLLLFAMLPTALAEGESPEESTEEQAAAPAAGEAEESADEQSQEEAKPTGLQKLWKDIRENGGFLLVCLAVFAGLFFLAWLFERMLVKNRKRFSDTHYIAYTAIFATMAAVLMLLEIPLFFAPSFYELDLSELPVMICTFYLGPVAGVVTEMVKVFLNMLFKGGSHTFFIGEFANFTVGCTFVLPASMIYHARRSKKTALIGMIVGTLVMTVFGSAFNALYLIPKYAEVLAPMEVIVGMGQKVNPAITNVFTLVLYAVVPFNLLKGAIITALTFLLYKRISPLMHKGDARRVQKKKA